MNTLELLGHAYYHGNVVTIAIIRIELRDNECKFPTFEQLIPYIYKASYRDQIRCLNGKFAQIEYKMTPSFVEIYRVLLT